MTMAMAIPIPCRRSRTHARRPIEIASAIVRARVSVEPRLNRRRRRGPRRRGKPVTASFGERQLHRHLHRHQHRHPRRHLPRRRGFLYRTRLHLHEVGFIFLDCDFCGLGASVGLGFGFAFIPRRRRLTVPPAPGHTPATASATPPTDRNGTSQLKYKSSGTPAWTHVYMHVTYLGHWTLELGTWMHRYP